MTSVLSFCLPYGRGLFRGEKRSSSLSSIRITQDRRITMYENLSYKITFRTTGPYNKGTYEYSGKCVEKGGKYYIKSYEKITLDYKVFDYAISSIDFSNLYTPMLDSLGGFDEDKMPARRIDSGVVLFTSPNKTYAYDEAVTVISTKFNMETLSVKVKKDTPAANLKSEMGLYVLYGGSNYGTDEISNIEGVDTSKLGSYTATITFANNKKETMKVDVVEDYVEQWPSIRSHWTVGTTLEDLIENLKITLKGEGEVPVTGEMVTGWDSSTEGMRVIELKYKNFSKKYNINICEEYKIAGLINVSISGNYNISGFVPIEKGGDWRRNDVNLGYMWDDGPIRGVSLTDTEFGVSGFNKDKTGFQHLDVQYKGNTVKLLFYVYDSDNMPVIDRIYYKKLGYPGDTNVVYCPVPAGSQTGLVYKDVYIDGTLSEEKDVTAEMIPGIDFENVRTVDNSINHIAEYFIRAGNLDNIYVINDTFSVEGKSYSKKTYIAYHN